MMKFGEILTRIIIFEVVDIFGWWYMCGYILLLYLSSLGKGSDMLIGIN